MIRLTTILICLLLSIAPARAETGLVMTIRTDAGPLPVETGRAPDLSVTVRVENRGTEPVVLAHPTVAVPHALKPGEVFRPDPEASHLAAIVESPDGKTTVFHHHMLTRFSPEGRSHLDLAPAEAAEFVLGKFGPDYSLGEWDLREPVFTRPGDYRLTIRYRNTHPLAYVFQGGEAPAAPVPVWTGETASDTLTVTFR